MISTNAKIRALALASIVALVAAAPSPTPSPVPTLAPGISVPTMVAPDCKPTPTPVPVGGNVLPAPSQQRCITVPLTKAAKSKPTPTPPPSRIGLSGVWGVPIQPGGDTVNYVHFKVTQEGDALTGVYLDKNNKPYPLAGVVKGANVRIVVTLPKGGSLVFSGSVSGTTDMLGMMTGPKGEIAFTAAYRPKSNLFDNIAPGAGMGGLGGNGGYAPPPRR